MNSERSTLDVAGLPDHAFGHRSLMWWGTLGLMISEGTMFAVLLAMYGYLRTHELEWPAGAPPPGAFWGTLNTMILLASCWPNYLYKRAAERHDLRKVRLWLSVAIVFAIAFVVVRVFEFRSLNCHWADNAYGSIVWTLLGFHTAHLVTDLLDSIVLGALMFTRSATGKRFVDVSENAVYWYFVVAAWMPIYVAIYVLSRW
jgi:heme/copper-type cytochrome/quinol oxidase subunit 3